MINNIDKFEYYRQEKKIKIREIVDKGISRSRYHRLTTGNAKLTPEDAVILTQILNLTPYEIYSSEYLKLDWFDMSHQASPYETYDIISVHVQILSAYQFVGNYPSAYKEVFNTFRTNHYIKEFFPLTILLMKILEDEIAGTDVSDLLDELYQQLMKRDLWTSYEVMVIFSLAEVKSFKEINLLDNLYDVLDDRSIIEYDDNYMISIITIFRYSLFAKSLALRDVARIKRFYTKIQASRHNILTLQVSVIQRLSEIIYMELTGEYAKAAVNLQKLLLVSEFVIENNKVLGNRDKLYAEDDYDLSHEEIAKWREELGVSQDYDLLT
ncbi:helix-turn-helix transcriptional regulator [Pseudolactococcus hodotermopsidis]|nr:helix-turn-helix transcriptional regulator [Lactococcus hodotermopsidis]